MNNINDTLITTQIDVINELTDNNIFLKQQLEQYKLEELTRHFEYEDILKELLLNAKNEDVVMEMLENNKKVEEELCVIF